MSAEGARAVYATLADPAAPMVGPVPADAPELLKSAFDWWSRRDEDLARETIRNRVSALVLGSAAVLSGHTAGSSDQANEIRIRRVLRWMTDNPGEDIGSDELARMAGLSPARFHHHFKRVTGSSPRDYWLRLRVELAARRLCEQSDDLTITRIAHEFGFSSSQYFATVFRRYLGTSPQAYRKAAPPTT